MDPVMRAFKLNKISVDHTHYRYLGGAEAEFADESGGPELVRAQLLEAGHDPAARGDGDQLDLWAAHPPEGKRIVTTELTDRRRATITRRNSHIRVHRS